MPEPAKSKRLSPWNLLLFLPAVALIFPGVYARATPELFGVPFFYWYQIAWIVITGLITAIVYRATGY
jgi:hypothetical protein